MKLHLGMSAQSAAARPCGWNGRAMGWEIDGKRRQAEDHRLMGVDSQVMPLLVIYQRGRRDRGWV